MGGWHGVGPTVTYEVWRSGPSQKAPDVRIFSDRTTPESARDALNICLADKADGYPDAPIEFYVVRVTRARERMTTAEPTNPDPQPTTEDA